MDKVVRYMKKRKLPNYFQRIIVDFHEYMAEKPSQDELMVGLPEPIKLRLSLLLNRDLVKDIPMLKQLPIGPIIGLMQKLSSEIYLPGEFAITAGDVGGTMHFVRSGEVRKMEAHSTHASILSLYTYSSLRFAPRHAHSSISSLTTTRPLCSP